MKTFWHVSFIFVTITLWILTGHMARAMSLTNGDFEHGTLSGWTVFTTSNGTVGTGSFPDIVLFQTGETGPATHSARFRVGQHTFDPATPAGGGIVQTTMIDANDIQLSADIAVSYVSSTHVRNLDAGSFDLLFDGAVVDRYAFGPISSGSILRSKLVADLSIAPGRHAIGLRMTRSFISEPETPAPFQYIDNVALTVTSTPEPTSVLLFGTGLAGLAACRWWATRYTNRRNPHA